MENTLPYYKYIAPNFNAQFGNKIIPLEDLVDEDIIFDQSGFKEVNNNVVDCFWNFIIDHIKDLCISNKDDCENKMKQVPLMTSWKSGVFIPLVTVKNFNTTNNV